MTPATSSSLAANGELIVDGQRAGVVKKPNYRGISESFWRSLKGVGDASTFDVMGTPYCGKGEPNQVIRVGHYASAGLSLWQHRCLWGE